MTVFSHNVSVRLLVSHQSIRDIPNELAFLKSLSLVPGVHVKLFEIPEQEHLSRISDSRYMVTDTVAYVGTSDWTADWFLVRGAAAMWLADSEVAVSQLQV